MVEAPERIWAGDFDMGLGHCTAGMRGGLYEEYVRADIAASQLAEARAERDTLAMHLEAKAILAKRDNARLREALSGACDQILDSYRTWVTDDLDAHPKQGQIPRYDAARAALAGKE